MFWETPLGPRGGRLLRQPADEPRIKTTLRIPVSVRERLRLEAEALNKSLTDLIAEKLAK
jgi:predicted HicB family RNase H-like nuclease